MIKKELLQLWETNQQDYATQEIGSGTQSFVRKVLESEDVFNLSEGAFQETKYTNSDYIAEESRKRNRADFVIRISSDIQIPIEVEKFQNIQAGVAQLARYQAVWEMKYGILTDGYEWRFYIGARYRSITLDELLADNSLFHTFWSDYVKPDNYYLFYFDHQEQGKLFRDEPRHIDTEIGTFFDNTTSLIRKFRGKLKLEQYFTQAKDSKEREKNATEITYAYIIQFILYKVLVDNNFHEFKNRFEEIRESITEALRHPSNMAFTGILSLITKMAGRISENVYRPFSDEQKFINEKLSHILESPKNTIQDIAPWLDMFVFIDGFDFSNIKNEIFGHVYENYLKELYSEENRGQYFTHPAVVEFMLKEIGYTQELVKSKNYQDISIVDPSCGSGTFLYKIVDILVESFGSDFNRAKKELSKLVHENVFGLDIEEFPLYLAEMSILMRMLPFILDEKHNNAMDKKIKVFKTKDSVAEFIGETQDREHLYASELDLDYHSFMRDDENLKELKDSLKGKDWVSANGAVHPPRRRFDFVIGNPPYIGANECYKQKVLTYESIKNKRLSLNDIYGINLHSVKGFPKKGSPKINLWAMFIALGQGLLNENGKISYIIPQALLTRPSYDVLRHYLSQQMVIEKIFIFANKLFVDRGIRTKKDITTSSLVFVIRKLTQDEKVENLKNNIVELIRYNGKNVVPEICMEEMKTRTNCSVFKIKQEVLQNEIRSWNHFFKGEKFLALLEKYTANSESMGIYHEHRFAQGRFKSNFWFDIWYNSDGSYEGESTPPKNKFFIQPKISSYRYLLTKSSYVAYYEDDRSKIKLLQANQGYHLLDSKYKIIWATSRTELFYFTEDPLILWGQDYGGIGSDNKNELLYLFTILNSNLTKYLVSSIVKPYNEDKFTILLQVNTIKQFIQVPIITAKNQPLKDRLIVIAQEILDAEKPLMKDCIDFGSYMMQTIDCLAFSDTMLIINSGDKETSLKFKDGVSPDRIEYNINLYLKEHKKGMSLLSLKNFPCIDNQKIDQLMGEANSIIYNLYGMDDKDIAIVEGEG